MKGNMIELFRVGQHVQFKTTDRPDMSAQGMRTAVSYDESGTIVRLHRSGRNGSAKIRRANGCRVTRRLQFVTAS